MILDISATDANRSSSLSSWAISFWAAFGVASRSSEIAARLVEFQGVRPTRAEGDPMTETAEGG